MLSLYRYQIYLLCFVSCRYVLTSDLGMKLEACFLSAFLFKALFRTTLPHPTADRDYALYEIGEGCEVQYLVPGVDLLSDRFRCEGRTLIATLRWVAEELSRAKHNLMVCKIRCINSHCLCTRMRISVMLVYHEGLFDKPLTV